MSWELQGNIRGPAGPTGPMGPSGAVGETGPIGPLGAGAAGESAGPDVLGPTSATTPLVFKTWTVEATNAPGTIHVWVPTSYAKTVATDRFTIRLRNNSVVFASVAEPSPGGGTQIDLNPNGAYETNGLVEHSLTAEIVRISGTGTATLSLETFLHWIFVTEPGPEVDIALTQDEADARYVNLDGDVMTGFLTLAGTPTDPLHAATMAYVDASGGGGSPGSLAFVYSQATPSAIWTISHGLTFRPNITVVDSSGAVVEGDIAYPSAAQVVLTFSGAFTGTAYLS